MKTDESFMTLSEAESILAANAVGMFHGSNSKLVHAQLLIDAAIKSESLTTPTHSEEAETTHKVEFEWSYTKDFSHNGDEAYAIWDNEGDPYCIVYGESIAKEICEKFNSHSSLVRRVEEQKKRIEELESALSGMLQEFPQRGVLVTSREQKAIDKATALTKP